MKREMKSSIFKGIILLSIFVILNKSKKLYKSNNKNNLGVKDELCS